VTVTTATLSIEAARKSVRIDVVCAAGNTVLHVWRVGPSGVPATVRGWEAGVVVGAAPVIVRDYEVPIGVPVLYYLQAGAGAPAGAITGPLAVTLPADPCEVWLIDLSRPINSIRVEVEEFAELDYRVDAAAHYVIGRRAPVVTSLPANTASGELTLLTDDLSTAEITRSILGTGAPFLLRTAPILGVGNMYLAALGIVEGRILADGAAPWRRFRVSVVQVERPNPIVFVPLAPVTWAGVKAQYPLWSDVLTIADTWDQLASTFPALPGGSPAVAWLPADV
jgi:hypothetical protein